jgi:hypothetical protein
MIKILNQLGLNKWVADEEAATIAAKVRQEIARDFTKES